MACHTFRDPCGSEVVVLDRMALLGVVFLAALVIGKLARGLAVPKVSGFLLAGFLVGPSVCGVIHESDIAELALFSRLAIALILFDIGGEFDPATLRREGVQGLRISAVTGVITAAIVATLLRLAGAPWAIAVVLALIALETSPSATVLVVKELGARGPVTNRLLSVVASDVVLAIAGYYLALSALGVTSWRSALISLGGGLVMGAIAGALLGAAGRKLERDAELLLFAFGLLLVLQGACRTLHVSAMLSTLVSGSVAASFPEVRHRIFETLRPISGLLYAILFVMAGARLHLDLLANIGWLGVAYLAGRAAGKLIGGSLAVRRFEPDVATMRFVPMALLPHAGVAMGLTMNLSGAHAEIGPTVTVVVLSAIVAFELLGPLGTSLCLRLAQETGAYSDNANLDVLDIDESVPTLRRVKS